jgi:hypothetical protein
MPSAASVDDPVAVKPCPAEIAALALSPVADRGAAMTAATVGRPSSLGRCAAVVSQWVGVTWP